MKRIRSALRPPRSTWALLAFAPLLLGVNGGGDFPTTPNSFAFSGVIEGFFGPVYSFEQRRSLFLFTARAGLNTYVYAPKNDPFHRERWRDPYPAADLAHFADLAQLGAGIGVRFVYAIAPGLSYDPSGGDLDALTGKLGTLLDIGVRDFCVLFDDVFGAPAGSDPDVQADIVSSVFAFLQARDPATSLCFISHFYEGTANELETDSSSLSVLYPGLSSAAAYAAYERIPPEVAIMWTGPRVFTDRLTVADAGDFRRFVGRPVIVWDNYPVNDAILVHELFLGPYQGREPGLDQVIDGILVNPMLEAEATKIPLWTVGRALGLGAGYDPAAAWVEALKVVSNRRRIRALETLADHFRSHPVIGDEPESAELAGTMDDFFRERSRRSTARLRRLFRRYARNQRKLERDLAPAQPRPRSNPALFAELSEASRKLSLLGEAGLLALRLLRRAQQGREVDVQPLRDALAAADAIAWLVGANQFPAALAPLLAEKIPPNNQDVFGDFFDRVLAELGVQ